MSRIGKQPVPLPNGVKVAVRDREVVVESGSKKLTYTHRAEVTVRVDEDAKAVVVDRHGDDRIAKAMHGMTRALVANMVTGVSSGFTKELEITGVGWTASLKGKEVALNVGYADTRMVPVPAGVEVKIEKNKITVTGSDKQAVGQLAARIRSHRPPEPYNGKGIKYSDERVIRKVGKAMAGSGA